MHPSGYKVAHSMMLNPLVYVTHRDRQPEAQAAILQAIELRATKETYMTANRQLSTRELTISRKKYYAIARQLQVLPHDVRIKESTLAALELVLHEQGFRYRSRYTYKVDPRTGRHIARNLQQLVFWLPEQELFGRRFISNYSAQIDATFNTNRSRLKLALITGVTNTANSFPAMQSFIKEEDQASWSFMLNAADNTIWPSTHRPKVIIGDFGKGLWAAIKAQQYIAVILQLCQWHAVQAMKKRINYGVVKGTGYTIMQREKVMGSFWPYVKSATLEELEVNRKVVLDTLKLIDRPWFKNTYVEYEETLIMVHIRCI
jgi:hypothetical protein